MAGVCSLLTGFHLIAVVQYIFTLHYLFTVFDIPNTKEYAMFHNYGGQLRFLTNWNLVCQTLLFTICFLNDIMGTNEVNPKKKPAIRKFKEAFHCSIGFPVAFFVGITFWGLYALDRELVFPKAIDPFFPTWLNHVMHTNIMIFTLVEHFSCFRIYPARKSGLTKLSIFMIVYLAWTFVIYGKSGRWVYPVMEVLNWPMRIVFILSMLAFVQGLYLLGEKLNSVAWGKEITLLKSGRKSK